MCGCYTYTGRIHIKLIGDEKWVGAISEPLNRVVHVVHRTILGDDSFRCESVHHKFKQRGIKHIGIMTP